MAWMGAGKKKPEEGLSHGKACFLTNASDPIGWDVALNDG